MEEIIQQPDALGILPQEEQVKYIGHSPTLWFKCPCGAIYSAAAIKKADWKCLVEGCGRSKTARWRRWKE